MKAILIVFIFGIFDKGLFPFEYNQTHHIICNDTDIEANDHQTEFCLINILDENYCLTNAKPFLKTYQLNL